MARRRSSRPGKRKSRNYAADLYEKWQDSTAGVKKFLNKWSINTAIGPMPNPYTLTNLWMGPLFKSFKSKSVGKQTPGSKTPAAKKAVERRTGTNFLTDEGTFVYLDPTGSASITNLSANTWKTVLLRQMNAAAVCPVPTTSGQFYHQKSTYGLKFLGSFTNNYPIVLVSFLIVPKGNWTPGEFAGTFEAGIKAQNSDLYSITILSWDNLYPKGQDISGVFKYLVDLNVELDLTKVMNQLQQAVNAREGLINEINTPNAYLGFALRRPDDGQSIGYSGIFTDIRKLATVPARL